MKLLGVDPGATTGWCLYDEVARRVVAAGQFPSHEVNLPVEAFGADIVVIERPVAHGPTRPAVVECAYTAGRLFEAMLRDWEDGVHELTRREVKLALTAATQRDVVVTDDATAWAALKLLHGGEGCDKKGMALHGVKAHERAALAVVVAWKLIQDAKTAGLASLEARVASEVTK